MTPAITPEAGQDRRAASTVARRIRGYVTRQLTGTVTDAAVFGRTETTSAPALRPYENTALRRMGATYEIYLHPAS